MKNLESAYFYLTCFGHWHLENASENQVTLLSSNRTLFNPETEKWIEIPLSKIILYRNRKYSIIKGALNYYDREILESMNFKLKL